MRLDLYQAESERIANEQMALLDEAKQRILSGAPLSRLEESGTLHALKVLIENAIGKSKHMLKSAGRPVPVSAYDAFPDWDHMARSLRRNCHSGILQLDCATGLFTNI